jgi:5-methylcytosine-specific restriction endonuclease McrA
VIRLPEVPLPDIALHQLEHWQAEVDTLATYPGRVEAAKRRFSLRNKAKNKTFSVVRRSLTAMCAGARRCGYCEDSAADKIEHVWPKDLYPELVFAWRNYLYACGPCNGPKNNRFAVFPKGARKPLEVGRWSGAPIKPPRKGTPALIDPRNEDPMTFLMLDLRGTFFFMPIPSRRSTMHPELRTLFRKAPEALSW